MTNQYHHIYDESGLLMGYATEKLKPKGGGAINKSKTHCPSGHPYNEENTLYTQSKRICRVCRKTQNQKAHEKRKNKIVEEF